VTNLFHADDRAAFTANMAGLRAGAPFTQSARIRRPDGELRNVTVQACAVGADLAGVMIDVTAQKLAEARMREANNVALQANAALREMSLEDNLTGLSNRRQFDLSLVHEFKRAVRSTLPLGLALIDVDHFRAFNELYGPAAGDACLRQVAQVIRNIPRRAGDIVARYAGEEVALLLPLADDAGAETVAQAIIEAVRAAAIPHAGSDSGFLTVSCGTASFTSVANLSNPLDLVRRADLALFKAKADGRDRVCRFELGLTNDLPLPFTQMPSPEIERIIKSRA
jgi:diguanylate cyclase (GGDEF)-like protein